jgi:DNA-binding response OmpR family regulator
VHVLVVDDHPEVRQMLRQALTRDRHRVSEAADIGEARHRIEGDRPDVVILDVALPDGSGIDLCRQLRSADDWVPILLLTAHGEVRQRVEGLDAGADDFVAKPFALAELRARVRALHRRGPIPRKATVRVGDVVLDLGACLARRDGAEAPITAREWAILEYLAARGGRVASRGAILEAVWGEVTEGAGASLEVLIGRIRRKLGSNVIRTVRGEGYALGSD